MSDQIGREAAKAAIESAVYGQVGGGIKGDRVILAVRSALAALPAADDGRPKNFMLYVEEEAKRTGLDPLTVLANEWAAHSKLKDESLWPDQSKLEAFAPPAPAAEQSEGPKNPPMAPRPKEAGE